MTPEQLTAWATAVDTYLVAVDDWRREISETLHVAPKFGLSLVSDLSLPRLSDFAVEVAEPIPGCADLRFCADGDHDVSCPLWVWAEPE